MSSIVSDEDVRYETDFCKRCGQARITLWGLCGDCSMTEARNAGKPDATARCFMLAQKLIGPLRRVAYTHGYALPEHGSLQRDIDLVAVPWTAEACDPFVLAEALRAKAAEINGYADVASHEKMQRVSASEAARTPLLVLPVGQRRLYRSERVSEVRRG
jgi:ribosomal protein S27AE